MQGFVRSRFCPFGILSDRDFVQDPKNIYPNLKSKKNCNSQHSAVLCGCCSQLQLYFITVSLSTKYNAETAISRLKFWLLICEL